jgi:ribosomal 50S subunit-recycling heat shock protein
MRLDLFLKASRLCLRRTVAQEICDAGLVQVNGRAAKSAHTVKPGDEIVVRRRNLETHVRVLSVPENRQQSRRNATSLYEVISEKRLVRDS